jgi:hypothetical protein
MKKKTDNRRHMERFDLQAPMKIEVRKRAGRREVLTCVTRDISSMGAFVETDRPLPEGVPLRLELLLTLDMLERIVGNAGARVKVRGKVLRTEEGGMAIQFERGFKIVAAGAAAL